VPRQDIDEDALTPADGQTFCPYKRLASYYDVGDHKRAASYYPQAWTEVARISNLVSFEPDEVEVFLDDKKLAVEPGQSVTPHGIDRGLDPDEILKRGADQAGPECYGFPTASARRHSDVDDHVTLRPGAADLAISFCRWVDRFRPIGDERGDQPALPVVSDTPAARPPDGHVTRFRQL
jgi:hypothetical protein